MSTSYIEELRTRSNQGKIETAKAKKRQARKTLEKTKQAELSEAKNRIEEAESPNGSIAIATKTGEKEAVVCVLRGGTHFEEGFRKDQSPKFLGRIGKTIHDHFISKGLTVSFRYWIDPMRIQELASDTGYELVVSW